MSAALFHRLSPTCKQAGHGGLQNLLFLLPPPFLCPTSNKRKRAKSVVVCWCLASCGSAVNDNTRPVSTPIHTYHTPHFLLLLLTLAGRAGPLFGLTARVAWWITNPGPWDQTVVAVNLCHPTTTRQASLRQLPLGLCFGCLQLARALGVKDRVSDPAV